MAASTTPSKAGSGTKVPTVDLPPDLRKNVQFGYYPSGHMISLHVDASHKLHDDPEAFITSA